MALLKLSLLYVTHLGALKVLSGLGLLELGLKDIPSRVNCLITIIQCFFAHGRFSCHQYLSFHEVRRLCVYRSNQELQVRSIIILNNIVKIIISLTKFITLDRCFLR